MVFRTSFVVLALALSISTSVAAAELTVSAASSLREAMTEIANAFEAKTKHHVTLNFGASGALAAQVRQGAPVDLFIAAAEEPVDDLIESGKLIRDTRINVASNRLVLVVPVGKRDAPSSFLALGAPNVRKIAVGEPKTVPAGQYAVEVFQALGLKGAAFDGKLIFASNVRQVLTYVETANVDAGLVYATDALASTKVRVVAEADAAWHSKVVYPAAVVTSTKSEAAARALATYLGSDDAQRILIRLGFKVDPSKT